MGPEIVEAAAFAPETLSVGVWARLFTLACYVAAAGSIFRGIREGARTSWRHAVGQVALFGFFALTFWAVESWAHHRTPYYIYSSAFWDLIPRIPFAEWGVPRGASNACTQLVTEIKQVRDMDRIPLGVVLMAASLTYSAMWTARLLGANLVVQPLLAGLVMVNIDLLLDPVLATTNDCVTGAQLPRAGVGLGLWAWYLDPAISAHWFDVPVFNYAAWFASPVLLVAITNLAGPFFRDWLMPRARRGFAPRGGAPAGWEGLLLLLIVAVVGFMFAITPGNLSPPLQWVALAGLLLLAAFFVAKRVRHFDFDCGVEATLTRPTALALTIPALALGVEGFFMKVPSLIPVAIFSISLGLLLAWLPCRSAVVGAIERTAGFDRFVRLHYFGFTAMLVLLGAAAVSVDPTGDLVVGLLLVAAAYHVFGYVLNDVVDLDLDRQQDRRGRDPLVRGSVSRESGLATALLAMPVIALIAFIMDVAPPAWLALAASLVLALVYNLWGKVTAVPPLTDAIQGLAWALLGLFAAWSANASLEPGPVADRLVPVLAYCGGFIFLINGIHGGLRDLWTDLGNGKKTSATFFGARPSVEDPAVIGAAPAAESSLGVQVFAFAVHSAMFAPMFWFLVQTAAPREGYGPLGHASASLLVAGIFVVSNVVLWRVVRRHEPQRGWWISSHLFVLLLPPLALYLPADFVAPIFKVLVAVCFFVPLLLQVGALERLARFLRSDRDPPPPPAPPWAGSTRDAPPPPPPAD